MIQCYVKMLENGSEIGSQGNNFYMDKLNLIFVLCLLLQSCHLEKVDTSTEFESLLVSSKQIYNLGETPKLEVSIKNNSGNDIYLISNLDGSAHKFRMPFCYFEIEKPTIDSLTSELHCANVNPLRKSDFILVIKEDTFNPYNNNQYHELLKKEDFRQVGKYRITFHYPTKSFNIDDFFGDEIYGSFPKQKELTALFELVPSIELKSNTIEVEIINTSL